MKDNDSWVYYNGELYHAGVKGMSWGKHLPGTDWWKKTTKANYELLTSPKSTNNGKALEYKTAPNWVNHIRANIHTAGQAAKSYGHKANLAGRILTKQAGAAISKGAYKVAKGASNIYYKAKKGVGKFWNQAKGFSSDQAAKLSEFAKQAYSEARKSVVNFFTTDSNELHTNSKNRNIKSDTPLSHLDVFQNKQLNDACMAYANGKANGSFGNKLNYWFQNAQYGIVKGVNSYLKQIGMDDEVDDFISKFRGDSSYRTQRNKKRYPRGGNGNNVSYTLN